MPRFTPSELLLATTLIAMGVGGLCTVNREPLVGYALWGDPTELGTQFLLFSSAAAIGAGVGVIFHRKLWRSARFSRRSLAARCGYSFIVCE